MTLNLSFNFYKRKRVFITGHTGFIGSWLTKWLSMLDAEVCGYSLDPLSKPNMYDLLNLSDSVIDIRGDIRNREAIQKAILDFNPEIVFHLAAQPIVIDSYYYPVETFDTNVTGTVNLLNELRQVDSIKTIIVMTSDKSYRNNEWVYPYRENDILGGKDPYSASKSCQDVVVESFRESYFSNSEVGISSVRAGNVIGGGDWAPHRIIPDLVRGIVSGEKVKIRNPNSVRPWQHVLEPISGILSLAERMYNNVKFSGAWNFGPEQNTEISVKELAESFINIWGSGSYDIDEVQSYKEANYLQLDVSKAKKKLNWTPRYNFSAALNETVDWYKEYYRNSATMNEKTEEQIGKYFSHLYS
ncbi:MAG: CDP-glucose 4,6-dehydratase [Candidatus Thermoplasmatota archaeon]|nr:CDP-glucose 4,6-dehydratase [Candidatus Thermoplasmatota archaeon]